MKTDFTPDSIRAIREQIGASPSEFGRLLLGADADRPDKFIKRLESGNVGPTRPVAVLLHWLDAGGKPPHYGEVMAPF
jgi:DNA-binding transcriptional regulator YiaG